MDYLTDLSDEINKKYPLYDSAVQAYREIKIKSYEEMQDDSIWENRTNISKLQYENKKLKETCDSLWCEVNKLKQVTADLQKHGNAQEQLFEQKIDSIKTFFEKALQEQEEKLMSEIYSPPNEGGGGSGGAGGIGYRKCQTHFETSTKK